MRTLALILLLTGCASRGTDFSWSDANMIRNGMTREQVIAVMGEPNEAAADGSYLMWSYGHANGFTGSTSNKAVKFSFGSDGLTYGIPPEGVGRYLLEQGY